MSRGDRRSLFIGVGVVLLLGLFVVTRFEVTSDISSFLPTGGDRDRYRLARALASGELSRTMILTLGAPDTSTAVRASTALEKALRQDPRIAGHLAFLEGGPPRDAQRTIWELYQPRRLGFAARGADRVDEQLSASGLRQAAKRLRESLEQPISSLMTRVAPSDPLLILPRLLERFEQSRAGGLRLEGGRFLSADGRFAVLFLGTSASAFDSRVQRPLLAAIDDAFAQLDARFDGTLTLDRSGVNRFAVSAERAIRADIQRVSVLSVVGLAILLLLLFRSLRLLALAAIPLGSGVVAGCAAVLAVFGQLHGITLAFGASLIGVCFDYVVHLYCHHAVSPAPGGQGARGTLKTIWKAILTGGATTMIGFAALGASAFQGLREVALFSTVGLAATLGATRFMLPGLVPRTIRAVPLRDKIASTLGDLHRSLSSQHRVLWLLPVCAIAIAAVGLPRVTWNDEFASLGDLDPELLAEDERVRARVAHAEQMYFVVALGSSEQAALEVNDGVAEQLADAERAGEIGSFRGVAEMLPSAARQRAVARAFRESPGLRDRLVQAFSAEGFRPGAFEPFFADLKRAAPPPLTYADLKTSPLSLGVRPFRIELGEQVGFISLLHGINDAEALGRRLRAIDGATFVAQAELFSRANRVYQRHTLALLGAGLLGVLLLLGLRYRSVGHTAAAIVPALLAAVVTVAVLALAGYKLDLVALTSLLMVVSMGVDYGVFLVDASTSRSGSLSAALLSVTVAGLSTVFGFSLLGLSEHPVLHSIGLTAGVGIVTCMILAPVGIVLIKPRAR